ncbi:unnamed protein product [Sphagnum jensenii]
MQVVSGSTSEMSSLSERFTTHPPIIHTTPCPFNPQATTAEDASTTGGNYVGTADDSRIQWKEATSANGAKYQIGVLKPDQWGAAEGEEEEDLLGSTKLQEKAGRSLAGHTTQELITHNLSDLWWPVTQDDSWKTPAQRIKDIVDISQYSLTKNTGWYQYVLWIKNTQTWDYTFYDETGDSYLLTTYVTGSHCVRYDSDKPTIVKIRATS